MEDVHWNAQNSIYGDLPANKYIPDMEAIRQSSNLYVYCMNSSVRYVDFCGSVAGDSFKSERAAAKDFAEEINGMSIQLGIEYGTYIYSWEEEKKVLFIPITVTRYSYVTPIAGVEGHVNLNPDEADIPEGTTVVAAAHTHGAYISSVDPRYRKYDYENDRFSEDDEMWAKEYKIPLYLAGPNGSMRVYTPTKKGYVYKTRKFVSEWELPHDKNHPDLPKNHKEDCENCFEKWE